MIPLPAIFFEVALKKKNYYFQLIILLFFNF